MGPLGAVPILAVLSMNKSLRICLVAFFGALLAACSSTDKRADTRPTPAEVISSGDAAGAVHWGGQIVSLKNLRDRTLVEVLAFPLDSKGRAETDEKPLGRFIIDKRGFLEPHEYARDRVVEVRGTLHGFTNGTVGEAAYRYPVVVADSLVLWDEQPGYSSGSSKPRVNFGIGVGNHGGGVGVGIGF